ncbi:recombination-associated protein RdgC [Pseudoalteromonas sp. McH1-7]|uniref:recombination-associated protein RdgC n=1 Tax=Pseudoalteromonas sp. McH1-7 TaxID=2745574 RepID=UPI00159109FE|nr:recombination-associated protein RdgC [Pseudoalteromonas sp. McH1-7]NUZ10012.1 recombination-associated protein RdgC [Pseudoalteromonas sp. McH1-7]
MFFTNAIAYKYKDTPNYEQTQFEEALQHEAAKPCGAQDITSFGWVNALGKYGTTLAHFEDGKILLKARRQDKVLPTAVINEMVAEKVSIIEKEDNRPVKKKVRDDLKENILSALLPSALVKSSYIYVFIDTKAELIIVNASSFNKAEETLALLRKSLGTLPVTPAFADVATDLALTEHIKEHWAPDGFEFGGDATFSDGHEKSSEVTLKDHELSSQQVQDLISNCFVTKVAMKTEQLRFTFETSGAIKQIKYSDIIKERNADIPKEDMAKKLIADFILTSTELTNLVNNLSSQLKQKIDQGYQ